MSRRTLFSSLFLITGLGVATPALAQPDDVARRAPIERGDSDNNDNAGMLGLLGLLGGLGLLGLKRRKDADDPVVRRRTDIPMGAH